MKVLIQTCVVVIVCTFSCFIVNLVQAQDLEWECISSKYGFLSCIAIDSSNQLLMGTFQKGVWVSTDNGEHFSNYNNGLPDSVTIFDMVVLPNGRALVATYYGVYYKNSEKEAWAESTGVDGYIHNLKVSKNGYVLASNFMSKVYLSKNNGETWDRVRPLRKDTLSDSLFVTPILNDNGEIVTWFEHSGLYRTSDEGKTWLRSTIQPDTVKGIQLFYVNKNMMMTYTRYHGVYQSSDNGVTWKTSNLQARGIDQIQEGLHHEVLAKGWRPSEMYYKTTDNGITWETVAQGVYKFNIRQYAISKKSGYIYAKGVSWSGNDIELLRYSNITSEWEQLFAEVSVVSTISTTKHGALLAHSSGFLTSTDQGLHWFSFAPEVPGCKFYTYDHNGNSYIATMYQGVYRSTDNEKTWNRVSYSPIDSSIEDLDVAPNGDIFVLTHVRGEYSAGKSKDTTYFAGGIYKSSDQGKNWKLLGFAHEQYLEKLDIDSSGNLFLYKLNSLYPATYRSTDNGSTWNTWLGDDGKFYLKYHVGLSEGGITSASYVQGKGVIASTEHGIYFLYDGTNEWELVQKVESKISCSYSAEGQLYISLDSDRGYSGIYKTSLKQVFEHLEHAVKHGRFWEEVSSGSLSNYAGSSEGLTNLTIDARGNLYCLMKEPAEIKYDEDNDILFSTDSGKTWNNIWKKGFQYHAVLRAFTINKNNNTLTATTNDSLYEYDYKTHTWLTRGALPFQVKDVYSKANPISIDSKNTIYVGFTFGISMNSGSNGIVRSIDGGHTWLESTTYISDPNIIFIAPNDSVFLGTNGNLVSSLHTDDMTITKCGKGPIDPNTFYFCDIGASLDGTISDMIHYRGDTVLVARSNSLYFARLDSLKWKKLSTFEVPVKKNYRNTQWGNFC